MKAAVLEHPRQPLRIAEVPIPAPGPTQILVAVSACGVCRTDLHIVDGELAPAKPRLIPGHEVVGRVVACGTAAHDLALGARVGVPWLGFTCGACPACRRGQENLCLQARFTGYTLDGGYAEYALAEQRYCFELPVRFTDVEAAPLLCAGLIGFRSYRMVGDAGALGIYGFGAASLVLTQLSHHEGRRVYAFTRAGDAATQAFARDVGAVWAGDVEATPPEPLDAAILFAPVGAHVPQALRAVRPGGTVVCGGIHMSDIPSFPYALLWGERVVRSVANLTRSDGLAFFSAIERVPLRLETHTFPLARANEALEALRRGAFHGAAVLVPGDRLRRRGDRHVSASVQAPSPANSATSACSALR